MRCTLLDEYALLDLKKMSTRSMLYPFERAVLSIHESLTHFVHSLNPLVVLKELQDEEDNASVDEAVSTDENDDIEANVIESPHDRIYRN